MTQPRDQDSESLRYDETLNLEQAAELFRIGVDSMRALVWQGAVPALSLNRKHLVLLRSQLLDYISREAKLQQLARRSPLPAPARVEDSSLPAVCRGRRRKPLLTLPSEEELQKLRELRKLDRS